MNISDSLKLTTSVSTKSSDAFSIVERPLMNAFSVILVMGLGAGVTSATAQDKTTAQLDEIVVTATRTEKPRSEIANTVSVISAEQIERELATGIDDLIRYEPGVSVSGSGRFGLNGFSIRGVGGDRVLTLVDGIPTADEFSFGPFLSSRRDFVDLDALKSVEIVRGPSSGVYGSNAMGGVVNFLTKNPTDYLSDEGFAGAARVGYSSIDSSTNINVLTAFGNHTWSGMVVGTVRNGAETETFFTDDTVGPDRLSQNPQDSESQNVYAKLVYSPSESQNLSLVAERFSGNTLTDVLTSSGTLVRGVLVNSEVGEDERSRQRLSLAYQFDTNTPLFDSLNILAYTQTSDAEQNTFAGRVSFGTLLNRTRDSFYEQDNVGARIQLLKHFEFAGTRSQLSYGLDYDVSDSITLREGGTIDAVTGIIVPEFLPFPTRDFPISEYTSIGAFVQNDIALMDGQLHIVPSLRYDSFELEPTVDSIFLSGNPGVSAPSGYDESELSAKLGVLYEISDEWSVFAQYAQGFRAPPLDAINTGFTNLAAGNRSGFDKVV